MERGLFARPNARAAGARCLRPFGRGRRVNLADAGRVRASKADATPPPGAGAVEGSGGIPGRSREGAAGASCPPGALR